MQIIQSYTTIWSFIVLCVINLNSRLCFLFFKLIFDKQTILGSMKIIFYLCFMNMIDQRPVKAFHNLMQFASVEKRKQH